MLMNDVAFPMPATWPAASPAGPCGPAGPCAPAEPAGPAAPCGPAGPWAPVAPWGPAGPDAPPGVMRGKAEVVGSTEAGNFLDGPSASSCPAFGVFDAWS